MRVLNITAVPISSLRIDVDTSRLVPLARIKDLAESINVIGVLHEPMVRRSDMRVITGRDRISAAIRSGWTEMPVKLIECTDAEAKAIEHAENSTRRHLATEEQVQQRIKTVAALEAAIAEEQEKRRAAGTLKGPRRGRMPSPRGLAIREIARQEGVSEAAVRQSLVRNSPEGKLRAKAHKGCGPVTPEIAQPDPDDLVPVRDFGLQLEPEFSSAVASVQELVSRAKRLVHEAARVLEHSGALPIPELRWKRLCEEVRGLGRTIDAMTPKSLCPFCKGQPDLAPQCASCEGSAWASKGVLRESIPRELLADEPLVVMRNGEQEVLELSDANEPPAAGPEPTYPPYTVAFDETVPYDSVDYDAIAEVSADDASDYGDDIP